MLRPHGFESWQQAEALVIRGGPGTTRAVWSVRGKSASAAGPSVPRPELQRPPCPGRGSDRQACWLHQALRSHICTPSSAGLLSRASQPAPEPAASEKAFATFRQDSFFLLKMQIGMGVVGLGPATGDGHSFSGPSFLPPWARLRGTPDTQEAGWELRPSAFP